ncbi:MAG: dipicolinate synthase subunit DpsA [Bacteroidota bacterium]
MVGGLGGLVIAVLGGDWREIEVIRRFLAEGARVKVVGYPDLPELACAERETSVFEALRGVDAVVVGMGGLDVGGKVRTLDPDIAVALSEEVLEVIPPGVPLFVGAARPRLKEFAARHGVTLVEVTEDDEVAIRNSIPTAEGAVQIAMEEMPVTLHSCRAVVVGFGRVGITLTRILLALGAHTTVAARNLAQLARAEEMGASTVHLSSLAQATASADVVFNTAPAIVLTEEVLKGMRQGSLVIDLASQPGGTDFQAAARYAIKTVHALGLPGKVAPRTAGAILAEALPHMIRRELTRLR